MKAISRRNFMVKSATAVAGVGLMGLTNSFAQPRKLRVAVVGTGGRGTYGLLANLLLVNDVEVVALCDLNEKNIENAAEMCVKAGQKKPKLYCNNETTYKEMLQKEKLDALLIGTYWDSHTSIAIDAMEHGVVPGIEVPCCLTIEDGWRLLETSANTGVNCMMLENWSFRKDNLALLNMVRRGMFGDIVHGHCAYSHNLVDHWYFDSKTGLDKWHAKYPLEYNRSQYPTHALGPMLSWMDINCGDVFTEIYSVSTAPLGIKTYFNDKFGPDHPNSKKDFKQGDIVTSIIKTAKGKTVVLNNDVCLPRPYSNRWLLQGTKGVYDEEKASIFLLNDSPKYAEWEAFKPYEEKYNHYWWKEGAKTESHGGTDFVMIKQFAEAVRSNRPSPLSILDGVVMSAIIPLSEKSIASGKPIAFPDFSKGKWESNKPYFGIV